jgi:hypothetical protein
MTLGDRTIKTGDPRRRAGWTYRAGDPLRADGPVGAICAGRPGVSGITLFALRKIGRNNDRIINRSYGDVIKAHRDAPSVWINVPCQISCLRPSAQTMTSEWKYVPASIRDRLENGICTENLPNSGSM